MTNERPDDHPDDDPTRPPVHGRGGRGVSSIVPHLQRQQQINDKPAKPPDPHDGDLTGEEMPRE